MRDQLAATTAELSLWRDHGLVLPVWWRDDDATLPSPALDRLLALSAEFGIPLHLAVIPQPATDALARRLLSEPRVFVLPHGWQHRNHAPADQKKAEFGAHRKVRIMLEEIAAGWHRISEMFSGQALPVFTPPWNRISPEVVARLPEIGLRAVSTFGPRKAKLGTAGVRQVNTHIDPIAWHAGGGLLDVKQLDAQMAAELQSRRSGLFDNSEPYGLLTHHLVQDEATWSFTEALLQTFTQCGVINWTSPLD